MGQDPAAPQGHAARHVGRGVLSRLLFAADGGRRDRAVLALRRHHRPTVVLSAQPPRHRGGDAWLCARLCLRRRQAGADRALRVSAWHPSGRPDDGARGRSLGAWRADGRRRNHHPVIVTDRTDRQAQARSADRHVQLRATPRQFGGPERHQSSARFGQSGHLLGRAALCRQARKTWPYVGRRGARTLSA